MKVGILKDFDITERAGGAQRAMQLFEQNAPGGVEMTRLRASDPELDPTCDVYITGLLKSYPDHLLQQLVQSGKPHVRYEFDLWEDAPNGRTWAKMLAESARVTMFASPYQRRLFVNGWHMEEKPHFLCLAPPMDLEIFKAPRQKYDELGRNGLVYFGEVHPLKGVDLAIRWAANQGDGAILDVYGPLSYPYIASPYCRYLGCPPMEELYDGVASHEWLVHMPRRPDIFSYSILEAQLLGLRVYASGKLGMESWLEVCQKGGFEELTEKCALSANEFWKLVELAVS